MLNKKLSKIVVKKEVTSTLSSEVRSVYDIQPPLKKKVTATREISTRYLRLVEEFIRRSRYGALFIIVFFLFFTGVLISALTVPEVKTIRALPQAVSGDWQALDNLKVIDLGEKAQYPEFSRLNSAYTSEKFSELNIVVPTSSDLSATSSEASSSLNVLDAASSSFSTTSYIKLPSKENFFTRLFKKLIFGAKAQELGVVPPSDTPSSQPSTPETLVTPPASVPETATTPPATSSETVSTQQEMSASPTAEATSEASIVLPNIDGVVTSTETSSVISADAGQASTSTSTDSNDYHLFASKKQLLLQNFKLETPVEAGAKFKSVNLNFSLMMQGSPTSSDEFLVEYSLDGSLWQTVTTLVQNKNYSNYLNDGYYTYPLPITQNDIPNISVRLSVLSDNSLAEPIFLDAAWLSANYAFTKKPLRELTDEEKQLAAKRLENFLGEKKDFTSNEQPEFQIKYNFQSNRFVQFLRSLVGDEYKILSVGVEDSGGKPAEVKLALHYDPLNAGEWSLKILERPGNFRPGVYRLKIQIQEGFSVYSDEQIFYWGVLAVNTDRATYLINSQIAPASTSTPAVAAATTAYIQLAALTETGHTMCSADLELAVTHDTSTEIFSTASSTIEKSGKCGPNNVIDVPDYFVNYPIADTGTYTLHLSLFNNLHELQHEIDSSFEVKNDAPFDIARTGPTRIYPYVPYHMSIEVTARTDFSGNLEEYFPDAYAVSDVVLGIRKKGELHTAERTGGSEIVSAAPHKKKIIERDVTLNNGDVATLEYAFDAPDVSPEFYLLGPLVVTNATSSVLLQATTTPTLEKSSTTATTTTSDTLLNSVHEISTTTEHKTTTSLDEATTTTKTAPSTENVPSATPEIISPPIATSTDTSVFNTGWFFRSVKAEELATPTDAVQLQISNDTIVVNSGEEITADAPKLTTDELKNELNAPTEVPTVFQTPQNNFFGTYSETREWQIASDALNYAGKYLKTLTYILGNGTNMTSGVAAGSFVYSGSSWNTTKSSAGTKTITIPIPMKDIKVRSAFIDFNATNFGSQANANIRQPIRMTLDVSSGPAAGTNIEIAQGTASTTDSAWFLASTTATTTNRIYYRADATALFQQQKDSEWHTGITAVLGVNIPSVRTENHNAKLVITYESTFKTDAHQDIKTVRFPLNSSVANNFGTKNSALGTNASTSFTFNAVMNDLWNQATSSIIDAWVDVQGEVSGTATSTFALGFYNTAASKANSASTTFYWNENWNDSRDIQYAFYPLGVGGGFATGTNTLVASSSGVAINGLGGEAVVTYYYNTGATQQTETVSYYINQPTTNVGSGTVQSATASTTISNSGAVPQNIWLRVNTAVGNGTTIKMEGSVGTQFNPSSTITLTSTSRWASQQRLILDMSSATSSLGLPSSQVGAGTTWTATSNSPPPAIEMFITFTWDGTGSTLTKTVETFAGVSDALVYNNANRRTTFTMYAPETVTKTYRSGYIESLIMRNASSTVATGTMTIAVAPDASAAILEGNSTSTGGNSTVYGRYLIYKISSSTLTSVNAQTFTATTTENTLLFQETYNRAANLNYANKLVFTYDVDVSDAGDSGQASRVIRSITTTLGGDSATTTSALAAATSFFAGSSWSTTKSAAGTRTVIIPGKNIRVRQAFVEIYYNTSDVNNINNSLSITLDVSSGPQAGTDVLIANGTGTRFYSQNGSPLRYLIYKADATYLFSTQNDAQFLAGITVVGSVNIPNNTTVNHSMKLTVLYEEDFNPASHQAIKTVRFPLDASGSLGTRTSVLVNATTTLTANAVMNDLWNQATSSIVDAWFEISGMVEGASAAGFALGLYNTAVPKPFSASTTYTLSEPGGIDWDVTLIYDPMRVGGGFATGTNTLIASSTAVGVLALGGELVVTYMYDTAATKQTETVQYYMNQPLATVTGGTMQSSTASTTVSNSGAAPVNIWYRVNNSVGTATQIKMGGSLGSSSIASSTVTLGTANPWVSQVRTFLDVTSVANTNVSTSSLSLPASQVYTEITMGTASGSSGPAPAVEMFVTFTWNGSIGTETKSVEYFVGQSGQAVKLTNSPRIFPFRVITPEAFTKTYVDAYIETNYEHSVNDATVTSSSTVRVGINSALLFDASGVIETNNDGQAYARYILFRIASSTLISELTTGSNIPFNDRSYVAQNSAGADETYTFSDRLVLTYNVAYASAATESQTHFRWRNDDGTESTATYMNGVDTPTVIAASSTKRLRIEISNTGGATSASISYRLEYASASAGVDNCAAVTDGNWKDVGAVGGAWDMFDSANISANASSTNIVGALPDSNRDFIAGMLKDLSSQTSGITLGAAEFTEIEYSLLNITPGDYCFRLTNAGVTSTLSYVVYPTATGPLVISGTVYSDEGVTKTTSNIKLAVNGSTSYSTSTEPNKTYKFDAVTQPNLGDTITVWMDNNGSASGTGTVVTRYNAGSITNLDIYKSDVIVRHENPDPIANVDIGKCTNNQGSVCTDTDIHIASSTANITISNDTRLYIWSGKTYTPGGNLTLATGGTAASTGGDLKWASASSTLSMGSNLLTIGGDFDNSAGGTFLKSSNATTTFNATSSGFILTGSMTGVNSFEKLEFAGNTSTAWTIQNAMTVKATTTDSFVTRNGTITMGNGTGDNFEVGGGWLIANTANESSTFQTSAVNNGGTIILDSNVNGATPRTCVNCTIHIGASSGTGQGSFIINKNTIMRLNPRDATTTSDSGMEVNSTGYLNINGSQDATNTVSSITENNSSSTITVSGTPWTSNNFVGEVVRVTNTSSLAFGKIYDISASSSNTITFSATTSLRDLSPDVFGGAACSGNATCTITVSSRMRGDSNNIGAYLHNITQSKYYQIVQATSTASASGTIDIITNTPDDFTTMNDGDDVEITDGTRANDIFEILDYAQVTAETGTACTSAVNQGGEGYILANAGSETVIRYADICNLGRSTATTTGVTFATVNGANANEGVTINDSRFRNNLRGIFFGSSLNNNNGKGVLNTAIFNSQDYNMNIDGSTGNDFIQNQIYNGGSGTYGVLFTNGSKSNTFKTNYVYGNLGGHGFRLDTNSDLNTINGNFFYHNGGATTEDSGIALFASSSRNIISNNKSFSNNRHGILIRDLSYNNLVFSNTTYTNGVLVASGLVASQGASHNTFFNNISYSNTNHSMTIAAHPDTSSTVLFANSYYGNGKYGLVEEADALVTDTYAIDESYGVLGANGLGDLNYQDAGISFTNGHKLYLYNSVLASPTEFVSQGSETSTRPWVFSRRHDGVAGATKIWEAYLIPSDYTETPQNESVNKFNYADNLWEKSASPHGYSGTGSEDANLDYDLASSSLSAGPYTYRLLNTTAGACGGVAQFSVTRYASSGIATAVGTASCGTQFIDSNSSINVKFKIDGGSPTAYALNDVYTFTVWDASNDTSTQKTVKLQQATSTFIVPGSTTLESKGGGGGANQFSQWSLASGSATFWDFQSNGGNTTTVQESKIDSFQIASGTLTTINTIFGGGTTFPKVATGTLNVDWYFANHVVNKAATSTNIDTGATDITVSESAGSSTVFKLASGSWGSGATSQTTGTGANGQTPEPNTNDAIRIREYSRTPSATSTYTYNVAITAQSGYSAYNYFTDYGSNYITSASTTSAGTGMDKVIGANWYRDTIATQNADAAVNDPPVRGTLEAGLTSTDSTLAFTLDSTSVNLGNLTGGNNLTATATSLLTVSTNAANGYNMYASETDLIRGPSSTSINDWAGTNAAPTTWTSTCPVASSNCGFGYSTNDADLTQFSSTKYAGFTSSTPGDIVAKSTGSVSNDATTITYRISTNTLKPVGTYSTTVIYVLVPSF